MPKSSKKKSLAAWPDDQKHQAVRTPQQEAEESATGSMPVSGSENVSDVDEIDESMGIYEGDQPKEVDIARELGKNTEN